MRRWLMLVPLAVLYACASDPIATDSETDAGIIECAPMTTQGCTCSNGLSGVKKCGPDSLFGPCSCLPPSGSDTGEAGAPDASCAQRGRYFVDADGDGFGAGPEVEVCEPAGPGYSTVAGDCDDEDARAFPGQAEPQEGVRKGVGGGDFNCDGVETKSQKAIGNCICPSWAPGWLGNEAACGETRSWMDFCSVQSATICNHTVVQRAQKCL